VPGVPEPRNQEARERRINQQEEIIIKSRFLGEAEIYTKRAMLFNTGVPSCYYGILTNLIHCRFPMHGWKANLTEKKPPSHLMKSFIYFSG
jgi:hypothetical protein